MQKIFYKGGFIMTILLCRGCCVGCLKGNAKGNSKERPEVELSDSSLKEYSQNIKKTRRAQHKQLIL